MSQDKVRAGAHSSARPRMKSLNQPRKLPVTGHRDRPHESQCRPLGPAPDGAALFPAARGEKRKPAPFICLQFPPSIAHQPVARDGLYLFPFFSRFCSLTCLVSPAEAVTLGAICTKRLAGFCGRKPHANRTKKKERRESVPSTDSTLSPETLHRLPHVV